MQIQCEGCQSGSAAVALIQRGHSRRLLIDHTGLAEALAALLTQRLGEERMVSFRFSRPSKSHLTYQLLSMMNSGQLKMYQADEALTRIAEEPWKQLRRARYRIAALETMTMDVNPSEGHDAFLISTTLLIEALTR
jgi:hypothetical protein